MTDASHKQAAVRALKSCGIGKLLRNFSIDSVVKTKKRGITIKGQLEDVSPEFSVDGTREIPYGMMGRLHRTWHDDVDWTPLSVIFSTSIGPTRPTAPHRPHRTTPASHPAASQKAPVAPARQAKPSAPAPAAPVAQNMTAAKKRTYLISDQQVWSGPQQPPLSSGQSTSRQAVVRAVAAPSAAPSASASTDVKMIEYMIVNVKSNDAPHETEWRKKLIGKGIVPKHVEYTSLPITVRPGDRPRFIFYFWITAEEEKLMKGVVIPGEKWMVSFSSMHLQCIFLAPLFTKALNVFKIVEAIFLSRKVPRKYARKGKAPSDDMSARLENRKKMKKVFGDRELYNQVYSSLNSYGKDIVDKVIRPNTYRS